MKNYIGNANFDFTCPKCKNKITASVNNVGGNIACPYCSQAINLQDTGFSQGINEANKAIDNFVKNLNKKFK